MINLRHAAGSLLVVGLEGKEFGGLERAWLKLVRPAGIILFRRNIGDPRQTRALLSEATTLCSAHSLRCVDLEGGTVDRLRDALAAMPSAQAVALAAKATGKDSWLPARSRPSASIPRWPRCWTSRCPYRPGSWAHVRLLQRQPESWSMRAGFWQGWLRREWSAAASIFQASAAARVIHTSKRRLFSGIGTSFGARTWFPTANCATNCRWSW